ncbi:MAG TPA: hypothetical protein VN969_22880 [Streptosporangiaceae bacterium]|nr:hypothetical protein [Streptosporangiaceae bacterium]
MTRPLPETSKARCTCGAQRSPSSKRCRKCSARGRWQRRKAWRGGKTPSFYRDGKK